MLKFKNITFKKIILKEDEQIAELTAIFKKVLFGIVESKNEKVQYASGNERINYSLNYGSNREMKFRDQFHHIPIFIH